MNVHGGLPTDRISAAITSLPKIHTLFVLSEITFKRSDVTIQHGPDKRALVAQAKLLVKKDKTPVDENNGKIVAGRMVQIKHNNKCIAVAVLEATQPFETINKLGYSFVPLEDTSSGAKRKKNKKKLETA